MSGGYNDHKGVVVMLLLAPLSLSQVLVAHARNPSYLGG
jgi:hypothetical protein